MPSTEHAVVHTLVAANPATCFAVITDLAAYPEWAQGVTAVEILSHDDLGRPDRAEFRAEAMGRATRYTLAYDYSDAPRSVHWSLVAGDLTRRLDGSYTFEIDPEAPGSTKVTYELIIDLMVPLPGFVKRRAETKIMEAALSRFRRMVENPVTA